jgi:hypothetical protein
VPDLQVCSSEIKSQALQIKREWKGIQAPKMGQQAGCRWLMPVIIVAQEAELRKISVRSQPKPYNSGNPISKNRSQKRAGRIAQALRVQALQAQVPKINPGTITKKNSNNK